MLGRGHRDLRHQVHARGQQQRTVHAQGFGQIADLVMYTNIGFPNSVLFRNYFPQSSPYEWYQ